MTKRYCCSSVSTTSADRSSASSGSSRGRCARLSLVQQVIDSIELDLDLLEPVLLVLTQARAIAGRGV